MKTVAVKSRAAWRRWLASHHDREPQGIWLVFKKGETGRDWLTYDEAVEEALCFGWIDSIIKRIDEVDYVRKFTPRKRDSVWSALNKKRIAQLIESGRMTPHGLALVEAAKVSGQWDFDPRPNIPAEPPPELVSALAKNAAARRFFESLAPGCRRQYLGWIVAAKRAETRERRVQEAIAMLTAGRKLGMK